ncbi:DNA topology modulation protein [Ornithinibacillus contaminans]|uniref:DNA topology modulation protein n=1 Tax=Ornithinibacillus contaminans TaxID=694055 RepID=UPI00064DC00A|nr:DNA topology modulation protein [Ornithinibacillus contaminans]
MRRIAIIGSGGSGKSTFARKLGEKLQINVYHLDALFWNPGWVGVPKDEQRQIQQRLVAEEAWIIDGNYGGTMDIRLNKADTIIFLDISRFICLYRVVKRNIQYRNAARPDMGEGCEERLDVDFLKWVWQYPKAKRPGVLDKIRKLTTEKEVIILQSPRQVEQFLQVIAREKNDAN